MIADEQLVDDELDFLGVEGDVSAPIALETEIARRFGVDLRIEIILLSPQCVGGIEVLEVLHQGGAVELAVAEIGGERAEPSATEQAARVAHGILSMHTGPVRHR